MSEHPLHFVRQDSYARICKDRVVTLRSAVFDADSDELIEFRHDLMYLHGGYGGAPAQVEAALEGLAVGMKVDLRLAAGEAFGPVIAEHRIRVSLDSLPEALRRTGAVIPAEAPDGAELNFRVTAIDATHADLDANHPLAGRALRFVLEVREIRAARAEELARGYAFKPGSETRSSVQ